MAATQYQIFCKYLNEDTNKIVNNSSQKEWISAETWYKCKIAYNVEDANAPNAMTISLDSENTSVKSGQTYKKLYTELQKIMGEVNPDTKKRLRYDDLSLEERKVYDICSKYEEILRMLANDECVIEYAMIRPIDELVVVPPVQTSQYNSIDFHHGGLTRVQYGKYYSATNNKILWSKAKELDNELSEIIYSQINTQSNEKYNMLFTFGGMIQTDEQLDGWISNNSVSTLPKFYKFYPDDTVCEYVATGSACHSDAAGGRGTDYKIGSVPIKSFNAPAESPKFSGNSGSGGSTNDVSFPNTTKEVCSAVYERMERLQVQPWFLIATCNSLRAAMTKVEQLIDIYGKDSVKLGKVVPIEQYIKIV